MAQIVGDHRFAGMLFIVGGIAEGKVHGFYLLNSKKEYITVPSTNCARIGETKVKSRQPCSFRWMSQHGRG